MLDADLDQNRRVPDTVPRARSCPSAGSAINSSTSMRPHERAQSYFAASVSIRALCAVRRTIQAVGRRCTAARRAGTSGDSSPFSNDRGRLQGRGADQLSARCREAGGREQLLPNPCTPARDPTDRGSLSGMTFSCDLAEIYHQPELLKHLIGLITRTHPSEHR